MFGRVFARRKLLIGGAGAAVAAGGLVTSLSLLDGGGKQQQQQQQQLLLLESREKRLERARSEDFDLIVIGGGATGAGIALDAVTRGLSVACLEGSDFSSGASSRSTKLIHGGVRYLEKAVKNQDLSQLSLVFDALSERKTMMDNAPHLTHSLPIITPCFKWWEVPYYWFGLKVYDLLAIGQRLNPVHFISSGETQLQFPMLKKENLKGGVVYYDGQMDDSRMNLSLALTAAQRGGVVLNHVTVEDLVKDDTGKVIGVKAKDKNNNNNNNESFVVRGTAVINACGPFVDHICRIDDENHQDLIVPAQGSHLILPDFYSPDNMGLIVPKTKDGRVVFMLPWLGHTLAGTTDEKVELSATPTPREDEVKFILSALTDYLQVEVRECDTLSTWAGIRPLARDPNAKDTQSLSRDHVIITSDSGLVTITGGKWTTYRRMAEQAVDTAVKNNNLTAGKCVTAKTPVVGAEGWDKVHFTQLIQNCHVTTANQEKRPIDSAVALHLSQSYGTNAFRVAEIAKDEGLGERLDAKHPHLEAEVAYSVRNEMALTPTDIIARRTRLAFLDTNAAQECLPRVAEIMAKELGWSKQEQANQVKETRMFLDSMMTGVGVRSPDGFVATK